MSAAFYDKGSMSGYDTIRAFTTWLNNEIWREYWRV